MLAGEVIFLKAVGEGCRGAEEAGGSARQPGGGAGWKRASRTCCGARARLAFPVSRTDKTGEESHSLALNLTEDRSRALTHPGVVWASVLRSLSAKEAEREAGAGLPGQSWCPVAVGRAGQGMAWRGMAVVSRGMAWHGGGLPPRQRAAGKQLTLPHLNT